VTLTALILESYVHNNTASNDGVGSASSTMIPTGEIFPDSQNEA
jgi:hypothetical protein